jgi:hypothetical protein
VHAGQSITLSCGELDFLVIAWLPPGCRFPFTPIFCLLYHRTPTLALPLPKHSFPTLTLYPYTHPLPSTLTLTPYPLPLHSPLTLYPYTHPLPFTLTLPLHTHTNTHTHTQASITTMLLCLASKRCPTVLEGLQKYQVRAVTWVLCVGACTYVWENMFICMYSCCVVVVFVSKHGVSIFFTCFSFS